MFGVNFGLPEIDWQSGS
jgi:hypothetical protein